MPASIVDTCVPSWAVWICDNDSNVIFSFLGACNLQHAVECGNNEVISKILLGLH